MRLEMNNYLTKKVIYITYRQFLNELAELKKKYTPSSHKKMFLVNLRSHLFSLEIDLNTWINNGENMLNDKK